MKIKNILKIILINLAVLLLFLLILEWIMYLFPNRTDADYIKRYNEYAQENHLKNLKLGYYPCVEFNYNRAKKTFRPVEIGKLKNIKRPVLFFGCSYTYGSMLDNNQTLPYKINKLTGRTTYNRGFQGSGPQLMLLQLKDSSFYKEVPDAQYIIYTFIWDHILRLYAYNNSIATNSEGTYEINPRYEFENGKLEKVKPAYLFFYRSFLVKKIQNYIKQKRSMDKDEYFPLFLAILKESQSLAKIHYKNPKFVILLYKDSGGAIFDDSQIKAIEKEGFIVIDAEKLVGHELMSSKYRVADKEHPSEQAWNEVAPKLIKELNL